MPAFAGMTLAACLSCKIKNICLLGRMKSAIKSLLVTTWIVILTFGALELGARVAFQSKLVPETLMPVLNALLSDNNRSYTTGSLVGGGSAADIAPRPYYLYINAPLSSTKAGQQVTPDGYRNGQESIKPDFKGLRILAIGGSTTYGWLLEDYHEAWPAQLEVLLKKQFSFPIQVVNAGLPAGTSAELLVAYALRDQFIKPDIVIIHNGGNDAQPLYYADYRPDYATFRTTVKGAVSIRPGEREILKLSALARLLYGVWLKDQNLGSIQTQPTDTPGTNLSIANVRRNEPIGFERNMNSLVTLIKAHGGQPILFPFHLAEKNVFDQLSEGMRYAEKTYVPLEMGLEKNKTVLRKLAQRERLPIYELPKRSIPTDDFFDHCHLKAHGETVKATFLAKNLIPMIEKVARENKLSR
ncbi:MAG: GDSL-type esterase/lipase family protein [Bdellovibrionales bacterium]